MVTIVKDTCDLSRGPKYWPNIHPVSNASAERVPGSDSCYPVCGVADFVTK